VQHRQCRNRSAEGRRQLIVLSRQHRRGGVYDWGHTQGSRYARWLCSTAPSSMLLASFKVRYDAEFVARMIAMFIETALVLLIRLKEGVANGDFVALHHASHELNSCSATVGAYSLAAHCERLEFMVRETFVPDAASARGYRYRISAGRSRFDGPLGRAGPGSIRSNIP